MKNIFHFLFSLCLHESLPRKSQRGSPGSSAKSASAAATPKTQEEEQLEEAEKESTNTKEKSESQETSEEDPLLVNRHYETIEESVLVLCCYVSGFITVKPQCLCFIATTV